MELPLEHPAVYTALIDEADYDFVLVMEDLLPSGEVGFLDWQVPRRGNWSLDLG
ncbi:aminoglycoside phosphotransferase [Mycobacterium shigaense]|uniref:Aminoglycoside phosphotransferase n=1 Tax=Mycobacterium shigaense TaxID=722731 RepID=A0A1Z4ENB9_9MYCO|nr:aminoglycoside phosphotransferase [Mycobacterium shigaense]